MTIIITLGNSDQIVQVSDRRLSFDGRLVDDEANKGGVFLCGNARLAFGFAGLAKCGSFDTQRWLLSNLVNLGAPEFDAKIIIDRLKEKASKDFACIPELARTRPEDKRLSIMFSGYLYQHSPPLAVYAILTNFQDFDTLKDDVKAWDYFKVRYWNEKRLPNENITLVQRIGFWPAMKQIDEVALRDMLREHKPAKAIVGKAVETVRLLADRPESRGTIGKQISTIVLPRDIDRDPTAEYHPIKPKPIIYLASMAISTKERQAALADPQLALTDSNGLPVPVIPKVGRNKPCPCGSGKKYKRCHGYFEK